MFALRKKSLFASMTKNMKEIKIIFDLGFVRNKYCLLQVKIKTLHYLLSTRNKFLPLSALMKAELCFFNIKSTRENRIILGV